MNIEQQPIAVDPMYRIRDNQLWYNSCSFADKIRNKAAVIIRIDGLGVRTLEHAAVGVNGVATPSYKLPTKADRDWWGAHNNQLIKLELLSALEHTEPAHNANVSTQKTIYPVSSTTCPLPHIVTEGTLCIGLDIVWFGGSKGDSRSQYDCLGAVVILPGDIHQKSSIRRVKLIDRDPDAKQLLRAIDELLQEYPHINRVVFAVDAPIQAIDRGFPPRNPNSKIGKREFRACEVYLSNQRKIIDRLRGGNDGWHPNIQPGAPLASRVMFVLEGLKKRGFTLWTREEKHSNRLVIECFPSEAIWAVKQLGYYPKDAIAACVKAYKKQEGVFLSPRQVELLVHDVLDAFGPATGNAKLWSGIVGETVSWLLNDPTWQKSGQYRGGKLFDDVVDTMICLATSLSYAYHTAHAWQDTQQPNDGHIIGPGFSNDRIWISACTDQIGGLD